MLSPTQFIEVLPLPDDAGVNRLDHAACNTESAERMRKYLAAKGWKTPAGVERGKDGSHWFEVLDPEGNKVQFVQPPAIPKPIDAPNAIGHHIIHVGLLVHDRAAEDKFYRDLLGFRPYWWGGRDGKTEWVSQQVPDAHDWIEYMMSGGPAGIPAAMTQRRWAYWTISRSAWLRFQTRTRCWRTQPPERPARPGAKDRAGRKVPVEYVRSGWTRVEVMNFHATEKPCCSPFTAEDPAE